MTGKKHRGSLLKIMVLGIALFAMIIISFIGSKVGSGIVGSEPVSFLDVEAPKYHPAPERPLPNLPITNTMITAWISIAVLFGLFFIGTRNMKLVPTGLQNLIELIVEAAANFIEDPAGEKHGRWFFPVCTTIFLFIVANAWVSLIPGFETISIHGEPLLRSANTDLNIPGALAVVSFCFVEYWGFKAKGASYLKTFFHFGPLWEALKLIFTGNIKAGAGGLLNGFVAVFAGLLEILSHLIRMMSFTFRLFGNMTAGMILVMIMIFLVPWVLPTIFYGMEAFFGFVQAMIFGGLTLGFACAAVMEEE
ncbi:MAG: F0F1 ATP synthase subunit A [Deltaproteobacteria bacterium]|nr:F0F1 ATP synthase subunit A [Deltaproteobacteria bacterium]MBW2340719.1 F0F1 ATP synthase subunit A [Deltaproteobacteria bacterium]